MLIRIVFTKTIIVEKLHNKKIEVGTTMDINKRDLQIFKTIYGDDSFSIVEMTEEDWLNLTVDNYLSSKEKLNKLVDINNSFNTNVPFSYLIKYYNPVLNEDNTLHPIVFADGLYNAYITSKIFKEAVDDYESAIFSKLTESQEPQPPKKHKKRFISNFFK